MSKLYYVEFEYYQYNSGARDNGYYKHKEYFKTLKEAKSFLEKVNKGYEAKHTKFTREEYADSLVSFAKKFSEFNESHNPEDVFTFDYFKGSIEVDSDNLVNPHIELQIIDGLGSSKYNIDDKGISLIID